MRDWATTLPAIVTAAAAFISFAPELFPNTTLWGLWVQRIAAFIAVGGLVRFGVMAKSTNVGSDRPQEIVDRKLDNVPPQD